MRTRAERGFSLVELMITIAIIGLAAGVVTPALLSSLPAMRTSAAAREVLSDCRYARTYAVEKGLSVVLDFDSAPTPHYRLFQDKNANNTYESATDTMLKQVDLTASYSGITLKSSVSGTPSDGVDLNGAGANWVRFNTNGTANSSGSVYVMPSADAGTTRTDRNRRVRVVQYTGSVSIESYSGGSWQ